MPKVAYLLVQDLAIATSIRQREHGHLDVLSKFS